MNRTITIGDIHGGLRALEQLLERIQPTPEDHLIFMGDYVDGWSESAQVIDYLIELNEKMNSTFIYGNHDAWCFDWLKNDVVNKVWQQHGGKSTIKSYDGYQDDQIQDHLDFFSGMKNYWVDDQNRLFIHAGFSSMHGPEREHYASNYGWDRTLWEMAVALHGRIQPDDAAYPVRFKKFKEIFIGHTPTTNYGVNLPWNRANIWNVDTGAAFMGSLSAMDIDTKEVWQSDPVWTLYPNEKGRN